MHANPHHPRLWHHAATFAVVLTLATVLACLIPTPLGLFLSGLVLAILLIPFAAALWPASLPAVIAAGCITEAIALVWLWPVFRDPHVPLTSWLAACLLLLAVCSLQFSLVRLLLRIALSPTSSAGLVALAVLLWLAAPVWLFPHLQTPALLPWIQRLIDVHPLFALNTILPAPIWTELPIAYTLLNLNQDIPYALPSSVLPAILLHAIPALLLGLIWVKAPTRTLQ